MDATMELSLAAGAEAFVRGWAYSRATPGTQVAPFAGGYHVGFGQPIGAIPRSDADARDPGCFSEG